MSIKACKLTKEAEEEISRAKRNYGNDAFYGGQIREGWSLAEVDFIFGSPYLVGETRNVKLVPRGQPKSHSVAEAIANTIIGYLIALAGQFFVYWWYAITVTLEQNLVIGAFFMAISLVRSYALRRIFNWMHLAGIHGQWRRLWLWICRQPHTKPQQIMPQP